MADSIECPYCGSTFKSNLLGKDGNGMPCCPTCARILPEEEFPDIPFEPVTDCKVNVISGVETITLVFVKKQNNELIASISLRIDDAQRFAFSILEANVRSLSKANSVKGTEADAD